jgi:hypothetical protein
MLGINADSCNALSSHFFGPLNILWLNHKHEVAIQNSFDTMVKEIRKTSLLPNIWDDAINAMLGLKQGNLSYAAYTQLFNTFSRKPLTKDLQCVRFIIGLKLKLKLKLKLFTTCTVCAGLHQLPYAPVAVSGPSRQCHIGNLQVRARPLTTVLQPLQRAFGGFTPPRGVCETR